MPVDSDSQYEKSSTTDTYRRERRRLSQARHRENVAESYRTLRSLLPVKQSTKVYGIRYNKTILLDKAQEYVTHLETTLSMLLQGKSRQMNVTSDYFRSCNRDCFNQQAFNVEEVRDDFARNFTLHKPIYQYERKGVPLFNDRFDVKDDEKTATTTTTTSASSCSDPPIRRKRLLHRIDSSTSSTSSSSDQPPVTPSTTSTAAATMVGGQQASMPNFTWANHHVCLVTPDSASGSQSTPRLLDRFCINVGGGGGNPTLSSSSSGEPALGSQHNHRHAGLRVVAPLVGTPYFLPHGKFTSPTHSLDLGFASASQDSPGDKESGSGSLCDWNPEMVFHDVVHF